MKHQISCKKYEYPSISTCTCHSPTDTPEKEECHEFETGQHNTAGQPIKAWQCYCGTTACLKNQMQNYHSVEVKTTIPKKEFERERCDACGTPHWKDSAPKEVVRMVRKAVVLLVHY